MNFTKDHLHQILDPHLSANERAQLRCQLAKQLEDAGNYEAARSAMGELWRSFTEPPFLEGLDQLTGGDVVLRIGALTGYIGSAKQIVGSQELAKNRITESIAIFESLSDLKKVAEAQTEIAVCYAREGQLSNAKAMLSLALCQLNEQDGELSGRALLRSAIIEKFSYRLTDALNILIKAAPLFEASTNHTLIGSFHNELGNVLRRLSENENDLEYLDRAVIEYTAASFHFEQSGHTRYLARAENNLALVYLKTNRLAEAHEHLDRAQALFTHLNDSSHLAEVDETRAQVMLAEGDLVKAEKVAKRAVQILGRGDEPSLLTEALITHGIALYGLNQKSQAQAAFKQAIDVSEQAGDLESAGLATIALIEQVGQELSDDELCVIVERARELLKNNLNPASRDRLLECAFYALSLIHRLKPDWTNYSLDQAVHRYEARLIRRALEDTGGVISRAADLLGVTYQRLQYMLKNPHKQLRSLSASSTATEQQGDKDDNATLNAGELTTQKNRTVRILHVEDDPIVAGLVQEIAQQEGWQVEHRAEGNIALQELARDADYDLLLVDHELPAISGLDLVEYVRRISHRRYMTIVMMSGRVDEAAAIQAGADAFLHKPEGIGLLVETINRFLADREQDT